MSRPDSHSQAAPRIPLAASVLEALGRDNPGIEVDQPTGSAISFMARVHQAKSRRGPAQAPSMEDDLKTGAVVFRAALAHLKSQGLRTHQDLAGRQEELARQALATLAQAHLSSSLFLRALRENGADGATLRLISHQAQHRNLAPLRERTGGASVSMKISKTIEGGRGLR